MAMEITTQCIKCGAELVCPNCTGAEALKERVQRQSEAIEQLNTKIAQLKPIGRNPQQEGIVEEQRVRQILISNFPNLRIESRRPSSPDDITVYMPNGKAISIDSKHVTEWKNEFFDKAEEHRKEVGGIRAIIVSKLLPIYTGGIRTDGNLHVDPRTGVWAVRPMELVAIMKMLITDIGIDKPSSDEEVVTLAKSILTVVDKTFTLAHKAVAYHRAELKRWQKVENDIASERADVQGKIEERTGNLLEDKSEGEL